MDLDDILVILLAGGVGERLSPLTKERAKPAVYFGGPYRIIDFTLSNCINSGLRRIFIATQYKSLSLNRHIRMGWNVVSEELGEFIEILPPQKRVGEHWYLGTADAVFQNLYSIARETPSHVIVLSGDHVYKMDYAKMLRFHVDKNADVTLATIEVPVADGTPLRHRRHRRKRARDRIRGEAGQSDAGAGVTRRRAGLDGHLHLPGRRAGARTRGGRGARRQPARLRAQHHPRADSHARRSSPIGSTTRTRRRRSTGATSARSTPTSKRAWICVTSIPSSTCTTRSGRCARISRRRRRPSSCSPRKGAAAARRSTRSSRTAASSRAAVSAAASSARTSASTASVTSNRRF